MVSATLSVLTAHVPSPTAPAITSFLWLGPALIFCNAAHQVDATTKCTGYRPLSLLVFGLDAGMSWVTTGVSSILSLTLCQWLPEPASVIQVHRNLAQSLPKTSEALGMRR